MARWIAPNLYRQWSGWRGPPQRRIAVVAERILAEEHRIEQEIDQEFLQNPSPTPRDFAHVANRIKTAQQETARKMLVEFALFGAAEAAMDFSKVSDPGQRRRIWDAVGRLSNRFLRKMQTGSLQRGQTDSIVDNEIQELSAILGDKTPAFRAVIKRQWLRLVSETEKQLWKLKEKERKQNERDAAKARREYQRLFGNEPPKKPR
jgi:hypothetical protein